MKRDFLDKLAEWKATPDRKPLLVRGARQVGKTWALQEFGRRQYEDKGHQCIYVDLREAKSVHSIFSETSDPREIIDLLGFRLRREIDVARDLLVLDEIQECNHAITSLKYFAQDLKEMDVIAAGSHLGLLKNQESFPVGKVNFLAMFPMTFDEVVAVLDPAAHEHLSQFGLETALPSVVHERLLEILTIYLFTGGLPEVVAALLGHWPDGVQRAITDVRKVQNELALGYRADFAKYSGVVNANHINCVFDALPAQLSRAQDETVKRFIFKDVVPNRKGFDAIRGPLTWLQEARLCIRSNIAGRAEHPLRSFCADNRFKVFLFDIGILNSLLKIPGEAILGEKLGAYKGFILENFVAEELFSVTNAELVSWQEGTAEIEFLVTRGADILPVEVKSAARTRRAKSLDAYIARYAPPAAFKLTRQNLGVDPRRGIVTAPVYCARKIVDGGAAMTSLPIKGRSRST